MTKFSPLDFEPYTFESAPSFVLRSINKMRMNIDLVVKEFAGYDSALAMLNSSSEALERACQSLLIPFESAKKLQIERVENHQDQLGLLGQKFYSNQLNTAKRPLSVAELCCDLDCQHDVHHRSYFSIEALSFSPLHHDLVVENCPKCLSLLDWQKAASPGTCANCSFKVWRTKPTFCSEESSEFRQFIATSFLGEDKRHTSVRSTLPKELKDETLSNILCAVDHLIALKNRLQISKPVTSSDARTLLDERCSAFNLLRGSPDRLAAIYGKLVQSVESKNFRILRTLRYSKIKQMTSVLPASKVKKYLVSIALESL